MKQITLHSVLPIVLGARMLIVCGARLILSCPPATTMSGKFVVIGMSV